MSITNIATLEIKKELSELIGEISVKGVFNSYGIFHKKLMFGLYKDDYFYLRGVGKLAEYLESQGAIPYMEHAEDPAIHGINFYFLPESIRENKDLCKLLILWSLEQIEEERNKKEIARTESIKIRLNLSVKHERLLNKIGINSIDDFLRVGPEHCYIELRKMGFSVNLNFFWNLTAAFLNKHVILLTQEDKDKAIEQLNTVLKKEGMRPVDLIRD